MRHDVSHRSWAPWFENDARRKRGLDQNDGIAAQAKIVEDYIAEASRRLSERQSAHPRAMTDWGKH